MRRGIDRISKALSDSSDTWVLGFSGGKDSTALLLLFAVAASRVRKKRRVKVVYCDTGVEMPPARAFALDVLSKIKNREGFGSVEFESLVATPKVLDSYFYKLIGKGYPPPTNIFRWCTDKIRIRPVDRLVSRIVGGEKCVLSLGVRFGESSSRDGVLAKRRVKGEECVFSSSNSSAKYNFCPIHDYSVDEVWETIIKYEDVIGIRASSLLGLYRAASGECPLLADPMMPPCGAARFGCWTCTVVKRDKTAESLVIEGYPELLPLLEFRDWLSVLRNDSGQRWMHRRNGQAGPGPFKVSARRQILERLLQAEAEFGAQLISYGEVGAIMDAWEEDLRALGAAA